MPVMKTVKGKKALASMKKSNANILSGSLIRNDSDLTTYSAVERKDVRLHEVNGLFCEIIGVSLRILYLSNRNGVSSGIQLVASEKGFMDTKVYDFSPVFKDEKELLSAFPSFVDVLKFFSKSCGWTLYESNDKSRVLYVNNIYGNEGLYDIPDFSPVYVYHSSDD